MPEKNTTDYDDLAVLYEQILNILNILYYQDKKITLKHMRLLLLQLIKYFNIYEFVDSPVPKFCKIFLNIQCCYKMKSFSVIYILFTTVSYYLRYSHLYPNIQSILISCRYHILKIKRILSCKKKLKQVQKN